jgi:cytochrome c
MHGPYPFIVSSLLFLGLAVTACGGSAGNPAAAPTLQPTPSGPTAGQLAATGKTVFETKCAKCHGENGQGVTAPPNIGPQAQLGKYNTAQGLYAYVSANMPQDAPGSLSPQEYLQVVSYLLVQNGYAKPETPIDPNNLQGIPLSK